MQAQVCDIIGSACVSVLHANCIAVDMQPAMPPVPVRRSRFPHAPMKDKQRRCFCRAKEDVKIEGPHNHISPVLLPSTLAQQLQKRLIVLDEEG